MNLIVSLIFLINLLLFIIFYTLCYFLFLLSLRQNSTSFIVSIKQLSLYNTYLTYATYILSSAIVKISSLKVHSFHFF